MYILDLFILNRSSITCLCSFAYRMIYYEQATCPGEQVMPLLCNKIVTKNGSTCTMEQRFMFLKRMCDTLSVRLMFVQ